ncbi:MAG: cadherin domain-containing protein [Planctomycetaceae bacterium]|nr:cadherin domain-containing protein [Planctomycetaceae bacterium]
MKFSLSVDGVSVYIDGTQFSQYAGALHPNTVLRSSVLAAPTPIYDDFNDGTIDSSRWTLAQDPTGQSIEETGGKLILYATANNFSRTQSIRSTPSFGTLYGASWTQTYLDNGAEQMNHYCEITNGTDYLRIFINTNGPHFELRLGGSYGSGTAATWNTLGGRIDISEEGGDIKVRFNGEVKYTLTGKSIAANSYFHAFANHFGDNASSYGNKRMSIDDVILYSDSNRSAELKLDNVQGTFLLPPDPVAALYDNFDDNHIDTEKFHVSGAVQERDGAIELSLFEQGNAVSGYISTNGTPDGINLRGFRVNTNRTTEPKKLTGWDTIARMRLTNGLDYIQIGWNLANNTFRIETAGAYGIHSVDIPVPAGEVPDGPVEVRERDGNIEVLHNGQIKLTLIAQTIRSGSFFTFKAAGNPYGQSTNSPPQDFGVFLDNLEFYHEPIESGSLVTPTLQQGSDSGISNTDHVTDQLDLNFEWTAGPEGTNYQWREGKLEDDGSISYGAWSAPQSETTADVHLAGASIHVFSVRTINSQGIVGGESSLGVQVDIANPTWISSTFISESVPHVNLEFSEPVVGNLSNLVIRDPSNQIISPTGLSGSGTSLLDLVFANFDQLGTYSISQSGLEDIAGNPVVESQLGTFTITNQAPTEIAISAQSVPENAPNSVIGSLSATDPDAWNSHIFAILPGGNGSQFVISGNELKVGPDGLDFEAGSLRTVTIRATDQFGESVDQQLTINVTDTNDAPALENSGDAHLAPIGEDDLHNGGTLITNLISSIVPLTMISDQDSGSMKGIAVYATEVTNGAWEYSLDSGLNWMPMGTVSTTSARLLSASTSTRIRFLPNANFNGQSSIQFSAWDQSEGTNGDTADISTRGGTTAFSTATENATLTVVPVNDAPVLSNSENPILSSIDEDDVGNNGTPVSTIIGNISSDVDAGAVQGIAIYNANTMNGRWQFSTNNGTSWVDIGNVTAAAARLISADSNSRIRFVPDADFNGTSTFHFCAWDQTSGVNLGAADVSARGGASAFSTGTVFATLTINPVEDPPFLDIPNSPVPQFFNGDTTISVFPEIAAGDVDANGVQGGTLVLTMNGVKNKKGWFDALNLPSISTIGSDSEELLEDGTITHRIQLKSDVSNTEVEDFLKSITFSTFKKGLKRSTRSVLLTLTDSGGLSTTRSQTIQVSRRQRR